ncbi:MAG: glycosyltransferase family 2 protein [Proteobacteria bacterium]|nr:glycosyltransferase family 2 protein [Pseudomonadota bacterium]
MSRNPPLLSVIVPAFNEAERIGASVERIIRFLATRADPGELVVVDDGSTDATFETVQRLARNSPVPVRIFRYAPNRGKGHALKVGFAKARGEQLLFTDADLSVPIEHAPTLLEPLDRGSDAAWGSRSLPDSDIAIRQPLLRQTLGATFTFLVRAFVGPVSDATCGFKAFRGSVGRELFAQLRIYDWSFDAEILYLLRRRGYSMQEVPVSWEHREGTKVHLVRDGVRATLGLLEIRLNAALGRYRGEHEIEPSLESWASTPQLGSSE